MTRGDLIGLILSYVYATSLLFIVEAIGKKLKWPQHLTRKIIHISAGLWIWGILYFFDHWYFGIIPFTSFIGLNYLFYRQQTFKAMDGEKTTLGTVYFAFSISLLFLLLWRTGGETDYVAIAAAAVMAMTFGDGMASIVGKSWGKTRYTFLGHTRTLEGSAAMLLFSFVGIFLTLLLVPGSTLSPHSIAISPGGALQLAISGALVATVAEAVSPAGSDNLSVPIFTGLTLFLMSNVI